MSGTLPDIVSGCPPYKLVALSKAAICDLRRLRENPTIVSPIFKITVCDLSPSPWSVRGARSMTSLHRPNTRLKLLLLTELTTLVRFPAKPDDIQRVQRPDHEIQRDEAREFLP